MDAHKVGEDVEVVLPAVGGAGLQGWGLPGGLRCFLPAHGYWRESGGCRIGGHAPRSQKCQPGFGSAKR